MNSVKPFIEVEHLWVLGLLSVDELPEWAASVLADGCESGEILQIAICSRDEEERLRLLFEKSLRAEGGGGMSKIAALKHYASQISNSILSGGIPPERGAKLIWDVTVNAGQLEFHELDPFIYAVSEMGDRPEDRLFFEEAIRNEARRWASLSLPN